MALGQLPLSGVSPSVWIPAPPQGSAASYYPSAWPRQQRPAIHPPSLTRNVLIADNVAPPGSHCLTKGLCTVFQPQLVRTGSQARSSCGTGPWGLVMWTRWWLWPLVAVCTADQFLDEAKRIMRTTPVIDG